MRKHARASVHPAVTAFQSPQKKPDVFGSHRAIHAFTEKRRKRRMMRR